MKRIRYDMPIYIAVTIILATIALIVTATFRLLHLLGVNNMVSFYPALDVFVVIAFLAVAVLAVLALVKSGYVFGKTLRVVFGVPVFSVEYDVISRVVRTKDGKLWLVVRENDKDVKLRICIKAVDEGDFVAVVRAKKADVTYEVEE